MVDMQKSLSGTALPLVGLIPAGGQGSRLSPLPCSKEILPIGFYDSLEKGEQRPKVASHYLLESMRRAGVQKAYIVLGPGKWDIPAYYGNGELVDMDLAYLMRKLGVPFTLDCAFPFTDNYRVACGFPDILFQPSDAFQQLVMKQEATGADLVLGIFPTNYPSKWDLVEIDNKNRIERIVPKPHQKTTGNTWVISVWSPEFSCFLHQFINQALELLKDDKHRKAYDEIPLGSVFQAALTSELLVENVIFNEGFCLDIGTPEDLKKALCMQL
jgi:glucose-1-phosphate thymidylyltransferase